MKKSYLVLSLLILFSAASWGQHIPQQNTSIIYPEVFKNPTSNVKVHTWWHWMDGAVTKEGISKDLESMKQQGIVQATLLNVGLFDEKNFGVKRVIFDSPEWHELFMWAMKEAHRLGITLGAHNCDGWSTSGGPWITPEQSMKQFVWSKTYIKGGRKQKIKLMQPAAQKDFYRDVVVLAYKTNLQTSSFHKVKPTYALNNQPAGSVLYDGNPTSALTLKKGDKITVSLKKNIDVQKIVIHPRKRFMWEDMDRFTSSYIVSTSADGTNYKEIKRIDLRGLNQSFATEIPATKAKYFQIEIAEIADLSSYLDFTIAEVELLQQNETPAYNTSTQHLLEKSVAVKASDRSKFESQATGNTSLSIDPTQVVRLNGKMAADGTLVWNAPKGNWCVLRFGYTTTGEVNSPATLEGRGLECDKMDTTALNHHFNSFSKKLIRNAGEYIGSTFKFLLIDSWECGYQNWTANLPAAFETNRGYNMLNWIPVLCGETVGNARQSEAFLYDFRLTIADMVENNYYKHFRDLCHRNKLEMHAEVIYGDGNYPPLDVLRTNSYADMPMFEFWAGNNSNGFTEYQPSKPFESYPVFAANAYQQPVMGAEAYTGFTHYSESPNGLKVYGDRAFCSGVNQMILHSFVHQPFDKAPGMTLGRYASHFNRNNPYWSQTSEWLNYQSRIQSVLQKGTIASNILYYIGDQLPQYIDNELVNNLPFGYRGMACNLDILMHKATVKNGNIVLDNGIEYPLLILPVSNSMEYSTLKHIAAMVEQGAVVLGPKPNGQLSMSGILQHQVAFDELVNKVWGNGSENNYGKGTVYSGISVEEVLQKEKISPEFKTNASDALNLMYIHKKQGDADIYFIANQRDSTIHRECTFAVGNKTAVILNPMDGSISTPAVYAAENGMVKLPVTFKPRESMIFIFENTGEKSHIVKVLMGNKQLFPLENTNDTHLNVPNVELQGSAYHYSATKSGLYTFVDSNNKIIEKAVNKPAELIVDKLEATLHFLPDYEANIAPITIKDLKSLTEFDDPQIKYFAGTIKYQIKFNAPDNFSKSKSPVQLDLGQFESTAHVSLNGKSLGLVWMPGTKLQINGLLLKDNLLEVTVKNVFRNRIIGDYIQYGEFKNVWTSAPVEQFLSKDKPLKPAGLMGPISLEKMSSEQ